MPDCQSGAVHSLGCGTIICFAVAGDFSVCHADCHEYIEKTAPVSGQIFRTQKKVSGKMLASLQTGIPLTIAITFSPAVGEVIECDFGEFLNPP